MAMRKSEPGNGKPRLLITLGNVAGIGPEVVARGWSELQTICRPIVIGDFGWIQRGVQCAGSPLEVVPIQNLDQASSSGHQIACLQATAQNLRDVVIGQVSAAAGRAAYDFLCTAIDLTWAG